eukprot:7216898-Lingulodinium_polyedra.AAC.1
MQARGAVRPRTDAAQGKKRTHATQQSTQVWHQAVQLVVWTANPPTEAQVVAPWWAFSLVPREVPWHPPQVAVQSHPLQSISAGANPAAVQQ